MTTEAAVAPPPMQVGQIIAAYMKLREAEAKINASVKDKLARIHAGMAKLEDAIKQQADAQGVTSFKTEFGTAFLSTTDYASVADWDAVLNHIKTNDAYDLLNKAVNKVAVRAHIDQTKLVPPGVNYGTKLVVNVRKPSNNGD